MTTISLPLAQRKREEIADDTISPSTSNTQISSKVGHTSLKRDWIMALEQA